MKRVITSLAIITLMFSAGLTILTPATAKAAECSDQSFKFPKWYDNLCKGGTNEIMSPNDFDATDPNAAGGADATQKTAGNISGWVTTLAINLVTILLTVVGYVSLGYVIYGGFKYMTSGDNSSGTAAGRKTITNALIGLILSIMSVAIVKFIAGLIG